MITLIQKPFLVSVTKGPKFRSAPLAPFVNVINFQEGVINVWHIRMKLSEIAFGKRRWRVVCVCICAWRMLHWRRKRRR